MKNYNNNERSNIEVSNTRRTCEKAVNSAELNKLNQKEGVNKVKASHPNKEGR